MEHSIDTEDGYTCSECGRPISDDPRWDNGASVKHIED